MEERGRYAIATANPNKFFFYTVKTNLVLKNGTLNIEEAVHHTAGLVIIFSQKIPYLIKLASLNGSYIIFLKRRKNIIL